MLRTKQQIEVAHNLLNHFGSEFLKSNDFISKRSIARAQVYVSGHNGASMHKGQENTTRHRLGRELMSVDVLAPPLPVSAKVQTNLITTGRYKGAHHL